VGKLSGGAASRTNLIHIVLALNARLDGAPKPDPAEAIDVQLVSCAEAVRMSQVGELIQAHDVASLLLGLSAAGMLNLNVAGD
jgi:hypothetical protein